MMGFFDFFKSEWSRIGTTHRSKSSDFTSLGKYKKVPRWVESRYWKMWKKRNLYNTTIYFKGKRFLYKIVTHIPMTQGATPRTYYKRLRRKNI